MPSVLPRSRTLRTLAAEIAACERCPRLRQHCLEVAREKRRAYADWEYWGRPISGFGDPAARLLIVGLAPAAHGANRTGRIFTGDRSGDFLYAALHRAGLASQPTSTHRDDGLVLRDTYITAAARCAPPGNKPTPEELATCRGFLLRELELLPHVRVVLTLGRIGHETLIEALRARGLGLSRAALPFGHGVVHRLPPPFPAIVGSFHVSQQNTFTGRLTEAMFDAVIARALAAM